MSTARRAIALLLSGVLLLVPIGPAVGAPGPPRDSGSCLHVDVQVSVDGEVLSKGPQIAHDGGFGHAGTGQTFTFQARTFPPPSEICAFLLPV